MKTLEEYLIEELKRNPIVQTYRAGETFINEEDASQSVYIIQTGAVSIYRTLESGKMSALSLAGPGDIVGDMAVIENAKRSATIEALTTVRVYVVPGGVFKKLLMENPDFSFAILRSFSRRLRAQGELFTAMTTKNLTERTRAILLRLLEYFPEREIPISQESLASIIGATRARVTEALHALEKERFLKLSRLHILIDA